MFDHQDKLGGLKKKKKKIWKFVKYTRANMGMEVSLANIFN